MNFIGIISVKDIAASLVRMNLVLLLGWHDIKQRYRRSYLGPFWITISMGVFVGCIGFLFGQILKVPLAEFLPFLAIGLIIWNFSLSVITEGSEGFISAESVIRQLPVPLFVHILRVIWRNLIILGHNLIIVPVIFFVMDRSVEPTLFLSLIGIGLLLLNLGWFTLLMSVLCTRFRDLSEVLKSILQVVFYLTPIMWMPSLLSERSGMYVLNFNPIFHLIELVRAPLLGEVPAMIHWNVAIVMAIFGWSLAILLYGKFKDRIAYWL